MRVIPALIYGPNHPYGTPLTGSGTTESIAQMTREDLAKFYQTWFRPNNATLIVVGDTTLAEITPRLERALAAWKSGQVPKKEIKPVPLPEKSRVYLIDKPGALQSVIIAGSIGPPAAHPQEIAIEAMNDGLGGTFASRINLNLREDKHWSYGAGSRLLKARGEGPFFAVASVQTDKTKQSLVEIAKEFRDILGPRPLSAKELADIQANETLSLPGSRETLSSVGASILEIVQFGLPDDYYETFAGKVRALTLGDLADAAKIVIHPDNLIWVVVGDRAKVEAEIKELGWGEVRLLSPDGRPL
jgi:zinc protease